MVPVVSRRLSPSTTEGEGSESNSSDSTLSALSLISTQPAMAAATAAPTIQRRLMRGGRREEWRGSRMPATRDQPDSGRRPAGRDRKSTRLNSSHGYISYAVFCLKKKKKKTKRQEE